MTASTSGNGKTMHRSRRRRYPVELAPYPVVRLRTQAEVDAFVNGTGG